ncbi:MAG: AMP-binding protein [Bacteroidales bacterium]|nr:AMP-binding protein [Bacteroidales bacterium]
MIKDFNKTAMAVGDRKISYSEMLVRISMYAEFSPKQVGDNKPKTIILSENREGWAYALFSIWLNRGIAVPVDAASTAHDIAYILNDCKPECIWVSREKLELAKQAMNEAQRDDTPINIIDDFEQVELKGEKADIKFEPDDTALIIYTSGTTGSPKGVMLSFENMNANIRAVSQEVPIFNEERRTMVLLPLHHVLPLVGSLVAPLVAGGGVAFAPSMAAGDIMATLQNNQIAIIIGVPRLWSTLYKGIKNKIDANFVTRMLFKLCAAVGSRTLSRTIFKSVRTKMGGKITYCVSGGAALDKEIGEGLKTIGLDVLEGYGMTEAAPMISFTRPDDICPGCSGQPMPSVKVEIRDGEVCAKGKNIMQGYYNRPEETADILKDGWLYTGDLGYLDDHGRLVITGRRKEIIVLSNGKNVNPNEIEFKLENYQQYVKEAGVIQDGDMLRAIIVPQKEWAASLSDEEVEQALKLEVLEPYNQTVAPYKKLMSLFVYRGDLPRTKLDKLQRFKLPALLTQKDAIDNKETVVVEPDLEEYRVIKNYIQEEKRCKVKPTDHIELDLAFDSLDKVGLQVFLQSTFGMEITTDQITSFKTISDMAEYVSDYKTRIEVEKIDWKKILKEHTNIRLPETWFTGGIFVKISKLFFQLYFKMTGKGVENIPEGPCIIAPNHQSFLDGMFVMSFLKYRMIRNTYFYAKEQHVKRPLLKFIANRHNVIILDMSNVKDSIQKLAEALKKKKNVIIFPEGTRTLNGKLGEFKKTFAILSKELNVPVVPVSIKGAFDAMPKGTIVPRPHKVQVEFLDPIYPNKRNTSTYEKLTDNVYREIEKNQMVG